MQARIVLLLTAALLALLAGCATTASGPDHTTSPTHQAVAGRPAAGSSTPPAHPTIEQPLDKFRRSTAAAARADPQLTSLALITALRNAGFAPASISVTTDRTTVGLTAPAIQFAVTWHGICLLGQHTTGSRTVITTTGPTLNGHCLVGTTRHPDA